jgi:hypothetical protein
MGIIKSLINILKEKDNIYIIDIADGPLPRGIVLRS